MKMLANPLYEICDKCSFPVMSFDERSRPKVVATCTLVKIDNNAPFLVNAAHTLKSSNIYICLPNTTPIELPFALKSKSDTFDKLDIAITPLHGEFGKLFFDYSFLPLNNSFNNIMYSNLKRRLIFFGYPASKSYIDMKKGIIKSPRTIVTLTEPTNLSEKNLEREYVDLDIHVVAHFPRRKMRRDHSKVIHAPLPIGMSGGPIFEAYVKPGHETDELVKANFLGIGTDYFSNFSWLKGTKKEAIYNFINNI